MAEQTTATDDLSTTEVGELTTNLMSETTHTTESISSTTEMVNTTGSWSPSKGEAIQHKYLLVYSYKLAMLYFKHFKTLLFVLSNPFTFISFNIALLFRNEIKNNKSVPYRQKNSTIQSEGRNLKAIHLTYITA